MSKNLIDSLKGIQQQALQKANEFLEGAQEQARSKGSTAAEDARERLRKARSTMTDMRRRLKEAEERSSSSTDTSEKSGLQKALDEAKEQVRKLQRALEQGGDDEGMAMGHTAWVRKAGGQGLNRRAAPDLDSEVYDSLAIGTEVTLLEGPNANDGYTWWRVRASDGREGWVAGEELVMQPE